MANAVKIIGAAIGWGAQLHETQNTPKFLWENGKLQLPWESIVSSAHPYGPEKIEASYEERVHLVAEFNKDLSAAVAKTLQDGRFPLVIGGDHSCAIGTWNGATTDLDGELGLVWIDAHMDAHTDETTPSHAIHGMPVAVLLGYGEKALLHIGKRKAVIKPENLVYIGVRDFEKEEALLLKKLGIKVYYMTDVQERGFGAVFKEAVSYVSQNTKGYGVSLDLDAFDPLVAPGVGSPAKDGIANVKEVCAAIGGIVHDHRFRGFEITELNLARDESNKTVDIVEALVNEFQSTNDE